MDNLADRTVVKLAITATVAISAIAWFAYRPHHDHSYQMVDDLVATELARWTDQDLTVHGWVETGSVVDAWHQAPTTSFVLTRGGKRIRVIAVTPSTWLVRDQLELVARGRLVPAREITLIDARCAAGLDGVAAAVRCRVPLDAEQGYVLVATGLDGRCPSKYDAGCRCGPPAPSDRFE